MDDPQKDGSDSDWDSTLDFTSPRHVGIGQFKPDMNLEVEEESSLSGESDLDVADDFPNDKQIIKNDLKPTEEREKASYPYLTNQKKNNIVLAQKKQNMNYSQIQPVQREEQTVIQHVQKVVSSDSPQFNFREALTDKRQTPEERAPPGKDKKGTTYDPAESEFLSTTKRHQGSIKSAGSWDESDPDERTLKEVRSNYRQERQREEQSLKEETSIVEDHPQTARSDSTWRNWKFGKKNKVPKKTTQSQASAVTATRRSYEPPQQSSSSLSHAGQVENVAQRMVVTSPSMVDVFDNRENQSHPESRIQDEKRQTSTFAEPSVEKGKELFEDPPRLFIKDEDTGRYVYYFCHGNLRYYEVNETFEKASLPAVADKVDKIVRRGWQEVFALLRILLSVVMWFIVELSRFLAKHIFQPLIIGIFVTMGDFVVKPFLSALFNGFVQPGSIFLWNVFTGMKHMISPFVDVLGKILKQFEMLFRSIRLFDITLVSRRDENMQHLQPHVIQTI